MEKELKKAELSLALFLDSYDEGKHPPIILVKDAKLIIKKAKQEMIKLFKEHFPKPNEKALMYYTEDGWNALIVDFEKHLK